MNFTLPEPMGVKMNGHDRKTGHGDSLDTDKEAKKMANIKKKRVRWDNHYTASNVAGYKLYWAVDERVDYDSDCAEVGNVSEVILPTDVSAFPLVSGEIELGVTAVNYAGNESDMAKFSVSLDFTAPDPPTDLVVESL